MDKLQNSVRELADPNKRDAFVNRNKFNLICYFCALVGVFLIYHLLSDGDFSFLLTLGGLTRMFGFMMLLFRIFKERNVDGLSLKTLELYAVVFFSRLSSILFYEGYLPYDRSGDWLYQAVEGTGLIIVCSLIYLMLTKFSVTYNADEDPFGKGMNLPPQFGAVFLGGPCLLLAILIHPSLNQNFITDVAWTFALYLETVAVIPQLYMFQKSKKPVNPWTSHFVFSIGLSRLFLLTFWVSSYHELSEKNPVTITGGWVGLFVLANQFVHLLVMGDFCYYYLKSAKAGTPLSLPGLQV